LDLDGEKMEMMNTRIGVAGTAAGIVAGMLAAVWLLAHPESPVLVYVAMVGFAVFALLAVVMSVVWVVQRLRA